MINTRTKKYKFRPFNIFIILLSEKTRTQNKRWAGFNDNLDFDNSSHEYPELSVQETKHALCLFSTFGTNDCALSKYYRSSKLQQRTQIVH